MKFRRATRDDIPLLTEWRWSVADWIHQKGSDQWDTTGLSREEFIRRISRSIDAGETWIALEDDERPVGTIAIDVVGDEGLWPDDELRESYVIHRMMVPRSEAGRGIGAKLVQFAEERARAHGRRKLVLDAWTSNVGLHRYYEGLGFRHVRTVANHWTPSAALFEKAVHDFNPAAMRSNVEPVQFRDRGR